MRDADPFKYLGVTLTMSLIWSYRHKCMTDNLSLKLNALNKLYWYHKKATSQID